MESERRSPPVDEDAPMTLAEACATVFRGLISPTTLRAEARRGRLVIERIGRRHFVTRAGLKEMRRLCQLPPDRPAPAEPDKPDLSKAKQARLAVLASIRADIDRRHKEERARKVAEAHLAAKMQKAAARLRAKGK